jgi:hypothetical protein
MAIDYQLISISVNNFISGEELELMPNRCKIKMEKTISRLNTFQTNKQEFFCLVRIFLIKVVKMCWRGLLLYCLERQ